jgi:cell division septal protein FtsQ
MTPKHRSKKQPIRTKTSDLGVLFASSTWRYAIASGVLGTVIIAGVLASPIVRIDSVKALGGTRTTAAEILQAAKVGHGSSMVLLDTGAIAARVEELPWVKRARVERQWPTTLTIVVSERKPVATTVNQQGNVVAVDASGRILGATQSRLGLPGLAILGKAGQVGSKLPASAAPCLSVASSLPSAFSTQVRAIVCIRSHLQLVFPGPVAFELSLATDLQAKYVAIASMISKVTFHSYDTVDVSNPANVTITPQPHA